MPRRREPNPATMPRGRGGGLPRPRVLLGKRQRRLAEEVLHLHSLWRRGPPPVPAPNQSASADRKTKTPDHKRRRLNAAAAAEPKDTGLPPPNSSPTTSPASTSSPAKPPPPPPPPPTSPGALAEREALRAAAEFFSKSKRGGSGSEGERDAASGFLTGLFSRDAALRGHYERSWEEGEFWCLACAAGGRKMGRRFRGCVSLVQHARDGSRRNGWPLAHRALARVLGRVLGWNIWKLPTIVIDPRGTLAQALAARAAADDQREKENDDTGEDDDSSSDDDEEEEYGTGEDTDSSSDEDEEEDVETWMEDSSTDGDEEESELETSEESAEKDVLKGDEDSKNLDDDGEATELDTNEKSAKKGGNGRNRPI